MTSIRIFAHVGSGFGPFLIRLGTRSPYSHVGFYDPDSDKTWESVTRPGVVVADGLNYPLSNTDIFIVELTVEEKSRLIKFLNDQLGKPYDWTALTHIFNYRRDWTEDDSWFCSELVAAGMKKIGRPLLRKSCGRISPGDVTSSTVLQPLV
jgi:uncharacterized protein YycO